MTTCTNCPDRQATIASERSSLPLCVPCEVARDLADGVSRNAYGVIVAPTTTTLDDLGGNGLAAARYAIAQLGYSVGV